MFAGLVKYAAAVEFAKEAGAARVYRMLMAGHSPNKPDTTLAMMKWFRRMGRYKGSPHPGYIVDPDQTRWVNEILTKRLGGKGDRVAGYIKRMNPSAIRNTRPILPKELGLGGKVADSEAAFVARLADIARGQGYRPTLEQYLEFIKHY